MDFGHGFLPRIDKRNWTGVDRALGPPGRLPLGDGVELDWAIVDHAYARARPSMPEALVSHGVKTIVDSSAWRYREQPTFDVDAMATAPYAPASPLVERVDVRRFVEADLRSQCELGADAYLIPGFVPRDRNDDVSAMTLTAVETALAMSDLDPRPFIAFATTTSGGLRLPLHQLGGRGAVDGDPVPLDVAPESGAPTQFPGRFRG